MYVCADPYCCALQLSTRNVHLCFSLFTDMLIYRFQQWKQVEWVNQKDINHCLLNVVPCSLNPESFFIQDYICLINNTVNLQSNLSLNHLVSHDSSLLYSKPNFVTLNSPVIYTAALDLPTNFTIICKCRVKHTKTVFLFSATVLTIGFLMFVEKKKK